MKKEMRYIAYDGNVFTSEKDCLEHEEKTRRAECWRQELELFVDTLPTKSCDRDGDVRSDAVLFDNDFVDQLSKWLACNFEIKTANEKKKED